MMDLTTLTIPSGTPGLSSKTLDLSRIYNAESRNQEIAFVTSQKAPELMALFNGAYFDLIKSIAMVELELNTAKTHVNRVRARILLDEVKDVLKAKGLTRETNPLGSEDIRRAVLEVNEEYISALDKTNFLATISEFLRGKLKGMDNAYTAVKKIMADSSNSFHQPESLSASDNYSSVGVDATPAYRQGFSKPKI